MVEVWLAMLVDELDDRGRDAGGHPRWLERLREQWIEQISVIYRGLVCSSLDALVNDETRRLRLVDLSRSLRERIASGTVRPPSGSVARAVGGAVFERDRFDEQILRVADSFLWLLDGGPDPHHNRPWQRLLAEVAARDPARASSEVGG
jgi:hypothetical protein